MQCGRLQVTLCPKAAIKQVHSRSRAAAPKASRRLSGELDGAEIGHSNVDFQPQTGQYHLVQRAR
jgi:hypothetical protein